ncbi:MAG: hypothetical protein AAFR81_15175 [Chloroflexota bacterium]
MADYNHDPTKQADVLKNLLGFIEEIRYKRYDAWSDRMHPMGYTFTQRELTQIALPTYGNLLAGRSKRLPARQQILDVAEYLECTIAETNDLLRCAQYLPQPGPLTEKQRQDALQRAELLMNLLPLPAITIDEYGQFPSANAQITAIQGHRPFSTWQASQKNIAHWFFDKTLEGCKAFRYSSQGFDINARGATELIWLVSQRVRHEPAFKKRLSEWIQLPDFSTYWHEVNQSPPDLFGEYGINQTQTPYLDVNIPERNVLIPMTSNSEIALGIGIPLNEAAIHVYKAVGCSLDTTTRWEEILRNYGINLKD